MRVIRINAVYGISSTGRTVKQLDEGLEKYGVKSTTVFSSGPDAEDAYRMGSPADVKAHSLLARAFGDAGRHSSGATRRLLGYLDSEKPDIVHLHNLHGNYIDVPMLLKYLSARRIPVVVTLHDCWWYTGKCCHYTADGCDRWQHGCGNCPRLKKDIPSWVFDRTAEMLAEKRELFASLDRYAVIGVSDWIANEARKSILKDAFMIKRIYNWIDTEIFCPRTSDIKKKYGITGKLILGVCSKWSEAKGLSSFIRLADAAENAEVVLIGGIPDGTDLGRALHIPATDSQRELAEWYSAAEVFVTLSGEESFGKVAAEALACGTPVITLNSTACPELVGEGCGEVVQNGEVGEILAAVERVLKAGKKSFAERCREFALANFDMEKNVRATYELYRELLNKE